MKSKDVSKLIHDKIKGAERQYDIQHFLTKSRETVIHRIRVYLLIMCIKKLWKSSEELTMLFPLVGEERWKMNQWGQKTDFSLGILL